MAKATFNCSEVNIPHQQMVELRSAGKLELGVNNELAHQIVAKGLGPRKTTATAAYRFWTYVAFAVFGYSIYLSFTHTWWCFIAAFIGGGLIFSAAKKSNSENLLDAAMIDHEFYERAKRGGGWLYRIDESETSNFRVS
jgi:hypothetical protein